MMYIFLKRQGRRFREPVSLASVTLFDIFIGDLADDRGRFACDMRFKGCDWHTTWENTNSVGP